MSSSSLHAHWDCFHGVSTNSMLAACLEVASKDPRNDNRILESYVVDHLEPILHPLLAADYGDEEDNHNNSPSLIITKTKARIGDTMGGMSTTQVRVLVVNEDARHKVPDDDVHTDNDVQMNGEINPNDKQHFQEKPTSSRTIPCLQVLSILSVFSAPSSWVRDVSIKTFREIAVARVATSDRNESLDNVFFSLDCVVETLATVLALSWLRIETFSCSRLPLGFGTTQEHSNLPVPSPLVLQLLLGMPTCPSNGVQTLTPAGVALLKVLTKSDTSRGTVPACFMPRSVGTGSCVTTSNNTIGSSTRDNSLENVICLRLIVGVKEDHTSFVQHVDNTTITPSQLETDNPKTLETTARTSSQTPKWKTDKLVHLTTNVDDTTPEVLAFVVELLLKNGAVDAWVQALTMKKGRPAHALHCLALQQQDVTHKLMEIMFRETSTLGIRIEQNIDRAALYREIVPVQTPFVDDKHKGIVNVKVGYLGENKQEATSIKAEYDHCRDISLATGVPLKKIANYAANQAQSRLESEEKAKKELEQQPEPKR